MKISMQIFPACMQDVYKRIHASRVTYERLAHVHSPYVHIFQQYLQHTYVSIHVRRDVREALHPTVRVYTRKCAANIVEKYAYTTNMAW